MSLSVVLVTLIIQGYRHHQETPEAQVGFADQVVDPGGILRRALLFSQPPEGTVSPETHLCSHPDAQLFSLSFQMALRYLAGEAINLDLTESNEFRLQDVVLERLDAQIGGYHNADAGGYQLLLNFRAAQNAVSQVSLTEVLSGQVAAERIRDRVILIGATTPEAKDDFYTPYSGGARDSQKMPGVIVHAQSVSQILSAVLDDRPLLWTWSPLGESIWIVIWGVGGALFAWYVRRPVTFTLGAAVLLGGLYIGCYLLLLQGGWIPVVPPALSLVFAAGTVVLLDRFNKSDYGQAVYKQVKSLLRIDIEIDQTIVGKQVSEITETEYFTNLQQQARQLRQRSETPGISNTPVSDTKSKSDSESDTTSDADDYFEGLKREARRLKGNDSDKADLN